MNELKIFENKDFGQIRVIEKDGQPWFVGKDICDCLELTDVSKSISRLDDDEKGANSIPTPGGLQYMLCVNEYGLYNLVLSSRKPEAKQFKRWITHEVIPSIRKHGAYMTPERIEEVLSNPDTIIRLATDLKAEREKRLQAERQIEQDKPMVIFAKALEISDKSILVGEMAKLLARNGIDDMGQNRFFKWLRDSGYLHKSGEQYNLPTQYSTELGLIEVKTTTINNPDGSVRVTKTPKITTKGQIYFVNKFKNIA